MLYPAELLAHINFIHRYTKFGRMLYPWLRRRSLYTTELLGHIHLGTHDYTQKDLNQLPLRRQPLNPGGVRGISYILLNFSPPVKEKRGFFLGRGGKMKFSPLQSSSFRI